MADGPDGGNRGSEASRLDARDLDRMSASVVEEPIKKASQRRRDKSITIKIRSAGGGVLNGRGIKEM